MKCSCLLVLTIGLLGLACHVPTPDGALEIVFVDVGQGYAVLLRTPDQRTCLIDGGPTYAGANEIAPLLDSLGVTELDYCIATNYTAGRIGGLDEVIRYLGGEEGILFQCFDHGGRDESSEYTEYRDIIGSRHRRMKAGDAVEMGELTIWCMASDGRTLVSRKNTVVEEKDRSIALLVTYWNFDLLITSDLAAGSGRRPALVDQLARSCAEVEMLAIGNHGNLDAITVRTAGELAPQATILAVGPNADNLPAQRTINRLTRRHRKVYQTRRTGSNLIPRSSGRIVNGDIWVTVHPDLYTVDGDTCRMHPAAGRQPLR